MPSSTASLLLSLVCMTVVTTAAPASDSDYILSDGNALLAVCGEMLNAIDRGSNMTTKGAISTSACTSYLRGFSHGVALLSNEPMQGWGYCIEPTIPSTQIARVTVKYLNDNPETLHIHPAVLVGRALQRGFPCKRE